MIDREIRKLEEKLKGVEKPFLAEDSVKKIKSQVFYNMKVFSVARFSLDSVSRARIKERIFMALEAGFGRRSFFFNLFVFRKKIVSFLVLIVFGLGFFNFLASSPQVVSAASFTVLRSYGGEVFVNRKGELIQGYEGMKLFEGDVIYTSEDGLAIIEYFENSVSRLSGDTELVLSRLENIEEDFEVSEIEVVVVRGVVWSKVLNLPSSDSGFFLSVKDVRAFSKEGAFNVRVDEDEFEIGVFNNYISLVDDTEVETISYGNKVTVSDRGVRNKKISQIRGDKEDWVVQNLENDRKYLSEVENKLLLARAKAVGINIDNDVSFKKSLKENALLFFTFDDVKTRKLELDIAERNFIAAQIKLMNNTLSDEEMEEVNAVIDTFSNRIKSFYEFAELVSYTDKEYAEDLKNYVSGKITVNKKDLSVVMPDSPIYVARAVVEELELLGARDSLDQASLKLDQIVDKIVSIDSVFYKDENFWTSDLATQYVDNITKAMLLVYDFDKENGEPDSAKIVLLKKIHEDLQLLEEMKVISGEEIDKFRSGVDKVVGGEHAKPISIVSVEEEEIVEEPIKINKDLIIRGPYGVTIYEDKPLPPFSSVSLD